MDVMAIIRIAMRALARNKMRSSITMLGIIIGVGAVLAMVSVGQGAQQQAQQQIAAMGSNVLFVSSGTVNRGGMRMGWGAIFFFSSRRRHTILQGDWSSDVCSSD